MAILINEKTKVIVQGITGKSGSFYAKRSMTYSPTYVGGVTPKKGGTTHLGLPVFDTVQEAKRETGCDASLIFVPPIYAADAILEAIEAEIPLIVCITEGIAVRDMMEVKAALKGSQSLLLGPNSPGVLSPNRCNMGIIPTAIHKKGSIGVISRSGTLLFEAGWQITEAKLGVSTTVGIGGDPLGGASFLQMVKHFEADSETSAILMIGEIGGNAEQEAAAWIKDYATKPVFAYISGRYAPRGRRMGHAGAIILQGKETAEEKIDALRSANVTIIKNPATLGSTIKQVLSL